MEDSQVLSAGLFASAYFSYVPATSIYTPVGGLDEQADMDQSDVWRHSFYSRRVLDIKHQSGLNASAFFDTGDLRHELKFGFGYRHIRFDSALSWPGDQLVGYVNFGAAAITRAQNSKSEVNLYDAFLGDTIQAGNLTVNVGARFDYQQGRNFPSAVPANPVFPTLLPSVQYPGDAGYPITWRQVEPRVGATYALGGNRTLLRASYSRFANRLDSITVFSIGAFPGVASIYYLWDDANGNGRVEGNEVDTSEGGFLGEGGVDRFDPGSIRSVNRIAPDLKPSTTDEFIVGVERQISSDVSGSLAYTYRVVRNLEFFPLVGTTRASYQYLGNASGTVSDGSFALSFDEPYYGLANCPAPCAGTELRNRPDATQTYSGVELQLIKSFSHGWMARVSFGYNDWRQQIGPGAIVDPNNVVPGTNANGPLVDGTVNATWQFNLSGMVQLPLGIAAGMNLFGRQGFPDPLLGRCLHERSPVHHQHPDRTGHALSHSQRLRARSAALEGLSDRLVGHGDPAVRLLQSAQQPHRAPARRLGRLVRPPGRGSARPPRQFQRGLGAPLQPRRARRPSDHVLEVPNGGRRIGCEWSDARTVAFPVASHLRNS